MSSNAVQQEQIIYPDLPLAIYREIAAHLQQVNGTQTLLLPQDSPTFDYGRSQIKALAIQYPTEGQAQVRAILDYYGSRYGAYQRIETSSVGQASS